MSQEQKTLPIWILIVSGLIALLELGVSVSLWFSPQSVLGMVDVDARGVQYVVYMWAARQFALGFIFAFATLKRSAAMLTISYVFFFVMFVGDFVIGLLQNDNGLVMSAAVMCILSAALLFVINRRK